eukprot:4272210-Prorocentrum_lima.AAC.1
MYALGALHAQLSARKRRGNDLLPPLKQWGTTAQDMVNAVFFEGKGPYQRDHRHQTWRPDAQSD